MNFSKAAIATTLACSLSILSGAAMAKESVSGSGTSTNGDKATSIVTTRDDGTMVVSISEPGTVCTAKIDAPADKARADLVCSDAAKGHMVLRLRENGSVKAIA